MQTCIVHLARASLRWVNYKDREKVAAPPRLIYSAPTEQGLANRQIAQRLDISERRV